jgi:hypothetical protein
MYERKRRGRIHFGKCELCMPCLDNFEALGVGTYDSVLDTIGKSCDKEGVHIDNLMSFRSTKAGG